MRIYKIRVKSLQTGDWETFFILCRRDFLPLFVPGCYKEFSFVAELPDSNGLDESEKSE